MRKSFYYIAKGIQISGLLLILYVLFVSYAYDGSMGFLYKFSGAGMGIFMSGWMMEKFC
jgi:hypothetical protein